MIQHKRISLSAPEPTDVDFIYMLENDVTTMIDGGSIAPVSRKQVWDYVETYDGDIYAAGQLRLIVKLHETGERIGLIDLYDYDKINRRAYIGIAVVATYRDKGLGTEALEALKDFCRQRLSMRQLAAVVRDNNYPSIALFTSAGFKVTGHFPAWIRVPDGYADALHLQFIL